MPILTRDSIRCFRRVNRFAGPYPHSRTHRIIAFLYTQTVLHVNLWMKLAGILPHMCGAGECRSPFDSAAIL